MHQKNTGICRAGSFKETNADCNETDAKADHILAATDRLSKKTKAVRMQSKKKD